jgi:transposase
MIGIDDWAWRRNQRYGTIICDLERRKTIALLPDREPATAQAWLSNQPQISIVSRDRGGAYALAAAKALPKATQVADRWHLMENASRAFLDAVRKSMRQIRAAIGAATINPDLLTAAERIQYEGYLRREDTNAAILGQAKAGATIKEIVRRTGYSRGLVRRILRGQRSDIFRVRESSLELYLPWLDAQWGAGHRNGAELWRQLKNQGFRGCLRVVTEWATRRRKAEKVDGAALSRAPSARTIARLMTIGRDDLSKSEAVTVAAIEGGVPLLVEAREIIAAFQAMIRKKSLVDLEPWLERARSGLVASFANGVVKDRAAVSAAITSPWSNGQTEGQITKLKLVKRQMYGKRCSETTTVPPATSMAADFVSFSGVADLRLRAPPRPLRRNFPGPCGPYQGQSAPVPTGRTDARGRRANPAGSSRPHLSSSFRRGVGVRRDRHKSPPASARSRRLVRRSHSKASARPPSR